MRGWSQDSALAAVEQLPPSVLLGAGIAVLVGMLGAPARALFVASYGFLSARRVPPAAG